MIIYISIFAYKLRHHWAHYSIFFWTITTAEGTKPANRKYILCHLQKKLILMSNIAIDVISLKGRIA